MSTTFSCHWIVVKSRMDHKSDVLSSAKPLLFLSKISGFCLFTIRDNFHICVTPLDNLVILCHIVFNVLLYSIFWRAPLVQSIIASELLKSFFSSCTFVTFIVMCVLKIHNFMRRQEQSEYFRVMREIDEDLGVLGVKFDNGNHRRFVVKMIFAVVIHHVVIVCLLGTVAIVYDWQMTPLAFVFIMYTFNSSQTSVAVFLCAVFGLGERIKAFNTVLRWAYDSI